MKAADVFNMFIQSGLFVVLLGLVVSGVKWAKAWLDTHTAEVTTKIKDTDVKNAVNTAENCVTTVVSELAQTTVDDLKAKSVDGKLTAEDAAKIKSDAVAKVQTLLSDDVTHTINTLFGGTEAWIDSKIEAAVKNLKSSAVLVNADASAQYTKSPAE